MLHYLLVLILLAITPFTISANGTFSYTTTGQIPNVTTVGKQYSITYMITSQYSLSKPISTTFKRSTPDFTLTNNCKTRLTAKESCTLVLNFKPKHLGTQSATLVAKDMEFHIINTKIQTTVKGYGHFVFEQNGKSISALNLRPNSTGTVSLKNTGNIDITDVKLSNLSEPGFTNVDCPTKASGVLNPKEYCNFNYQIGSKPKATAFTIIANGKNANNNPQNLPVNIATNGHFVFEQNGKPISALNLKPQAMGTVTLKNTGGIDITDVKVTNLNQSGFTNVNCPTEAAGTLPKSAECKFTYQIITTPKENKFTIVAIGKGTDNNKIKLPVSILFPVSVSGDVTKKLPKIVYYNTKYPVSFTFKNNSILHPATNVSVKKEMPEGFTVTSDTCNKTTLSPSQSCQINGTFVPSKITGLVTLGYTLSYNEGANVSLTTQSNNIGQLILKSTSLQLNRHNAPDPNSLDYWGNAVIFFNFNTIPVGSDFKVNSVNIQSIHYGYNPNTFSWQVANSFPDQSDPAYNGRKYLKYIINREDYAPGCSYLIVKYELQGKSYTLNTPSFTLIAPGGEHDPTC